MSRSIEDRPAASISVARALSGYRRLVVLLLAGIQLVACSSEDEVETRQQQESSGTETVAQPLAVSEACAANQASITTGYYNFPGLGCSRIAKQVATDTSNRGYRNRCKKKMGVAKAPTAVARVQVQECGPLRQEDGSYASLLICCGAAASTVVEKEPTKVIAYDVQLDCPDGHVQVLAAGLNYPALDCPQAVARARSQLDSSHYKRACAAAMPNLQQRQSILDADVFTCRPDAGAVVDVAVCCSATRTPTEAARPMVAPDDIWEVLRLNDLFGLQLILSRQSERAAERGAQGITPLHRAGSLAIANVLISRGADHKATDSEGYTPLHNAVMNRHLNIAARLLKLGANVDAISTHGNTALDFAVNRDIAALLLSHQANPNGVGQSRPLHSAAFYGRDEVVRLLIQRGSDINRTDTNGETPLHRAVFRRHLSTARLLIDMGAKVNVRNASGKTPLDMATDPEVRAALATFGGISGK